ncbi:Stringent starvation protein B, partial [Methylobacterium sp. WL103]
MADDLIRYDLLVQDALRGVVRKVLTDAAREGLAGEHHFYVSFRTEAPGVRMSQALREKYPQDMTIVLQHQFWDLGVTEHSFEVGLSFSGVPERLLVPFDALSGFFDPSVQFGLKFDLNETAEVAGEDAAPSAAKAGPR